LERRVYFLFGDLLACTVTGAAAAWLAWIAVPAGWIFPAGMVIGMGTGVVIGMFVGLVGGILFTPIFGSMEISMPATLAGMVAGMAGGMLPALAAGGAGTALWVGAAAGLVCLAYTYVLQARLRGEVE
jgi:hypothetical protein